MRARESFVHGMTCRATLTKLASPFLRGYVPARFAYFVGYAFFFSRLFLFSGDLWSKFLLVT